MHVSFAAIKLCYRVAMGEDLPANMPFATGAKLVQSKYGYAHSAEFFKMANKVVGDHPIDMRADAKVDLNQRDANMVAALQQQWWEYLDAHDI